MSTNFEYSMPSPTAPGPLTASVKALQVNGYPMAYAEQGAGVPVVLVHGTNGDDPCGSTRWNRSAPRMGSMP